MSTCPSDRQVRVLLAEEADDPRCGQGSFYYAVWKDTRLGPTGDLFAQKVQEYQFPRLDVPTFGRPVWIRDGVAVTTDSQPIERWGAALDGEGGIIVVYVSGEPPGADILAQRIDRTGRRMWDPPVVLAEGPGANWPESSWRFVVSDGSGGAIASWEDCSTGSDCNVHAGRILPDGSTPWGTGGRPVTVEPGRQFSPLLVEDGEGGAVLAWSDETYRILAQRIDGAGTPLWAPDGVDLGLIGYTASGIATDSAGGAYVAWGAGMILLQRVAGDGSLPWDPEPQVLWCSSGSQDRPRLAPDGEGGVILTWSEDPDDPGPSPTAPDIWATRIAGEGWFLWPRCVPITDAPGDQHAPFVAPAGYGGAYITWADSRPPGSLYLRHIDGYGDMRDPPALLAGETGDSDHDGLIIAGGHYGLPAMEAFRTNRCGHQEIWLQELSGVFWWDSMRYCDDSAAVCPAGEASCHDCDTLLFTVNAYPLPDGTRNSLRSKAETACGKFEDGQGHTAGNVLCALHNETEALLDKKISPEAAADLLMCVDELAETNGVDLGCRP